MKMKLGQHRQLTTALDAVAKPPASVKKLQTNIDEELHRRFKTRPQGESSLYKKLND